MVKNPGINGQFGAWIIAKDHPPSTGYAAQTAVAAVVSYLVAHLFRLPEAYWAPMSTLIVMQSTLSAALPIAVQYVAGTASEQQLAQSPTFTSPQTFGRLVWRLS